MSVQPHPYAGDDRNRVIALPAYLGNSFNIASIKEAVAAPLKLE